MGLRPKGVCLFNCRLIHAYLSASSFSCALLIATLKTGTCSERCHMNFSPYEHFRRCWVCNRHPLHMAYFHMLLICCRTQFVSSIIALGQMLDNYSIYSSVFCAHLNSLYLQLMPSLLEVFGNGAHFPDKISVDLFFLCYNKIFIDVFCNELSGAFISYPLHQCSNLSIK